MQQDAPPQAQAQQNPQDSFLGSFDRVPSGLDPTQVYSYFLKVSAQIAQLEERTRQVSAPLVLEAAMREAAEIRTQSAQAAERAYNEIVQAARQESERVRMEAEQNTNTMLTEARSGLANVQRQAEELLESARQQAGRVRQQAWEDNQSAEQELERLCVDLAALIQRMLDRRKSLADDMSPEAPAAAQAAIATPGPVPTPEQQPSVPLVAPQPNVSPPVASPPTTWPQAGPNASVSPPATPQPPAGPQNQPAPTRVDTPHAASQPDGEVTAPQQPKEGFRLPSWLDD
jgi:hypothetical protein